ncbi:MAG: hypothetical protein MUE34_04960 [Acidimicrobiales bacterium]|jgi:hypothetical protein|nr:hypothetical protein [Acidimicrobiales bacterium]
MSNRWKLIAGGAALAGVVTGGLSVAGADDGWVLRDPVDTIDLAAVTTTVPLPELPPKLLPAEDLSPESVDSPNESVEESVDSPFDSPDDPAPFDLSPESADSPLESAEDSPVEMPEPVPSSVDTPPAPAPAFADDSVASAASAASTDSLDSVD